MKRKTDSLIIKEIKYGSYFDFIPGRWAEKHEQSTASVSVPFITWFVAAHLVCIMTFCKPNQAVPCSLASLFERVAKQSVETCMWSSSWCRGSTWANVLTLVVCPFLCPVVFCYEVVWLEAGNLQSNATDPAWERSCRRSPELAERYRHLLAQPVAELGRRFGKIMYD